MKVLLDENLPHGLRHLLSGHEVFTVAYMKWSSLENGALLKAAAAGGFDVMLTMDSGVQYQQYMSSLPLAVLVMSAQTNKLDDIRGLAPAILTQLNHLKPRTVIRVG